MKWIINKNNCYAECQINNWLEIIENIENIFVDHQEFIYRGHQDSDWMLESTFDRYYRLTLENLDENLLPEYDYEEYLQVHLENFKVNSIGRRINSTRKLNDFEWWALGQHYGLVTPLLDWSKSPYIALYFALNHPLPPSSNKRTLWVFNPIGFQKAYEQQNIKVSKIKVVDSPVDENVRLLSQKGKFTFTPNGLSIENYIKMNVNLSGLKPILFRIDIPEKVREIFLLHLNSMNINHSTIYPDLKGASGYSNSQLEISLNKKKWQNSKGFKKRSFTLDYLQHD
ncbi:FRG domain-containing protein [Pseudofulvibacter geojedonensis]|uniref:FRG domain-containing protein n=1 Tax=Pseudofulvibacter geojedonensis TaxID=1123758 RepID=A0ABW3I332_9FLAO